MSTRDGDNYGADGQEHGVLREKGITWLGNMSIYGELEEVVQKAVLSCDETS